jgi:hypothetical protein
MSFESCKLTKSIGVTGSLLLVVGVVFLPTVEGYSVSIYNQIPLFLQTGTAVLILGTLLGALWALYIRKERLALYLLLPVLSLSALMPFIPKSMGYVIKFGDHMNHAGTILDLLSTGTIPKTIYPGMHILSAFISTATGLSVPVVLSVLGSISVLLFYCTTALLSHQTNIPPAAALIFAPLAVIPTAAVSSGLTYMALFPLILWITLRYTNGNSHQSKKFLFIPLILVGASMWMYHIVPTFVATVGISIIILFEKNPGDNHYVNRFFDKVQMHRQQDAPLRILDVILIAGFLWMSYTILFKRAIIIFAAKFTSRNTRPPSLNTSSLAKTLFGEFGLSIVDVGLLIIRMYGDLIVVCTFAGLGILICLFSTGVDKRPNNYSLPFALTVIVVGGGMWSVLEMTIGIIPRLNFVRVLEPVLMGGLVACGVTIFVVLQFVRQNIEPRESKLIVGVITLLLVTSPLVGGILISYNSTYNSPDTYQANRQILPSDVQGMGWYFDYKSREIKTTTLWRYNFRYVNYILRPPIQEEREAELDGRALDRGYRSPAHFGYQNNTTFVQTVGCKYYIEGKYDRATYLQARSDNKFIKSDFDRLEVDPTVGEIYSNGNMNISKIAGC